MTVSAIHATGLTKRFGGLTAVDCLNLEIPQNTCVGILGPNGAGKTTTLELLEGLQEPTEGKLQVLGLSWATAAAQLRRQVGVQLQETHFFTEHSAEEVLTLFDSFFVGVDERPGLGVDVALESVQLQEKRHTRVEHLSGGQRQRLALAVALLGDPLLLFLDEPTTGLDPQARRSVWDSILALRARQRTVVLTTHSMEEAEALCDRVVIIDRGRVIADDAPSKLIARVGGEQIIELTFDKPIAPQCFERREGILSATQKGDVIHLRVVTLQEGIPVAMEIARTKQAAVQSMITRHATLDDVFLQLTGKSLREGA